MMKHTNSPNASFKRDEPLGELENQFILRLPPGPAAELRQRLREGHERSVKKRLSIQIDPAMRTGNVRFDDWIYPAKLVDLPCAIECLKTTDKKTFYKTADISQMLVYKDEEESPPDENTKKDKNDPKSEKKYMWPHGVTPPLKNVRKQRFRKVSKKKHAEAPEIEKELQRLFRVDSEAVKVHYEIVYEDDDDKKPGKADEASIDVSVNSVSNDWAAFSDATDRNGPEVVDRNFITDLFGDIESSSDEDMAAEIHIVDEQTMKPADEDPNLLQNANSDSQQPEMSAQQTLLELRDQIQKIQQLKQNQEAELARINNETLKLRLQQVVNNLQQQQRDLQQQYNELHQSLQY